MDKEKRILELLSKKKELGLSDAEKAELKALMLEGAAELEAELSNK